MQNCTHALPSSSLPLLPGSTWSSMNSEVWDLPSHVIGLRWLWSQVAATWLDPSCSSARSFLPDAVCFAEIHRVSPTLHR